MEQHFIKNSKYEILGNNGWEDFDGIIKNYDTSFEMLSITTDTNKNITCTTDHKIISHENKIEAQHLNIGDMIDTVDGHETILSIDKILDRSETYDIFNSSSHKIFCNNIKVCQCDEFAFLPKHVADAFWAANYPTISASIDAKIMIISTPNGMFGQFHIIYSDAEKKENSFIPYKSTWRDVPGRDNEWAETQRKNLGDTKFAQEYECDFLGSTNTVVNTDTLKKLFTIYKRPILLDLNSKFRIWEKPNTNNRYVIGADVSKGTGNDFSVCQVLKIISLSPVKFEQVAVFEDNKTDVYLFTDIIHRISVFYNNAYIMVENNAEGAAVVNKLWWDIETDKLVNTGSKAQNLGIRATKSTKPKAVLLMKKLIEEDNLILRDKTTIEQLSSFIEDNGQFYGKDLHDDLVSALYWATYIIHMDIFDENVALQQSMFIKQKDDDNDDVYNDEAEVWGILSDVDVSTDNMFTDDLFTL